MDPSQKDPIDGGVFTVLPDGTTVIPVNAKLKVKDAAAFAEYLSTKSDDALKRATLAPLLIAEKSTEVLLLAQGAAPKVTKAALPDLKGAMRFAGAASEHAAATARYNLQEIADKSFVEEVRLRLHRIP